MCGRRMRTTLWLVGVALVPLAVAEQVDLSTGAWTVWLDTEADWQQEPPVLPPVDLAAYPVRVPTGGWQALYDRPGPRTALPATAEQFAWGRNGNAYGIAGDYRGVSWFTRSFEAGPDWAERHVTLEIESVSYRVEVFVNETLVAADAIAGTPLRVDIGRALKPGASNRLALRITDPGGSLDPEDTTPVAWAGRLLPPSAGFGGITGRVGLHVADRTGVEDVFVKNRPDPRTVDLEVTLRHAGSQPTRGTIRYRIVPVGGRRAVAEGQIDVTTLSRRQVVQRRISCKRAALWSPESPRLHDLSVTWEGADGSRDTATRRFGLRWFDVRPGPAGPCFTLNGRRVVLRGARSWGRWSGGGLTPSVEAVRQGIGTAKALGLNTLVLRGGVPSSLVLEAADALGLLCWVEPARCAVGVPEEVARVCRREALLRILGRVRNHPALVGYGLYPAESPGTQERADLGDAHRLDETRLLTCTAVGDTVCHWLPYDAEPRTRGWRTLPGAALDDADPNAALLWVREAAERPALPALSRIRHDLAAGDRLGWDGAGLLDQAERYEHFLTVRGFRDAFAGLDALSRSLATVAYEDYARRLEALRAGDRADAVILDAWEDVAPGPARGLVDRERRAKADPVILARANAPAGLSVRARDRVVAVDEPVVVDLDLLNEADLRGELRLDLSATDRRGLYTEQTWSVPVTGGETYGQSLVRGLSVATRTAGVTTLHVTLHRGKTTVATGQEQIYAVAGDPNRVIGSVGIPETEPNTAGLLHAVGIEDVTRVGAERPSAACVLAAGPVPAFLRGPAARAWWNWIADGHGLVVIGAAGDWADHLGAQRLVAYRGARDLGAGPAVGGAFVRDHPLVAGLPVNTALDWAYAGLLPPAAASPRGLRLEEGRCVIGAYVEDPPEMLTVLGTVPVGRGRIVLCGLDLAGSLRSGRRDAVLARRLLQNLLAWAVRPALSP